MAPLYVPSVTEPRTGPPVMVAPAAPPSVTRSGSSPNEAERAVRLPAAAELALIARFKSTVASPAGSVARTSIVWPPVVLPLDVASSSHTKRDKGKRHTSEASTVRM